MRMYRVDTGEVHLVRNQATGQVLTLQRAGHNAVIADASLYAGEYHCDAIANDHTVVSSIAVKVFSDFLQANPKASQLWMIHLGRTAQDARFRAEMISLKTVDERLNACGDDIGRRAEQLRDTTERGVVGLKRVHRGFTAHGFDASYSGGDRRFTQNFEVADDSGRGHVCSPAEFHTDVAHRYDAYHVVIFLTKERHRTRSTRGFDVFLFNIHLGVGTNVLVHQTLDVLQAFRVDAFEVREVEA